MKMKIKLLSPHLSLGQANAVGHAGIGSCNDDARE